MKRKKTLTTTLTKTPAEIPAAIAQLKEKAAAAYPNNQSQIEISEFTFGLFKGQYLVEVWIMPNE